MTRRVPGSQVSTPGAERRPWRRCRPLAILLLAGIAVTARPAHAEEPPAADATALPEAPAEVPPAVPSTPVFVIESITVEGMRHGSERIVTAETLLTIGQAYTEKQLQQALHRVERLPFVVEADFALRKGTERGRFELVITIVETKPVFSGGELGAAGSGGTDRVQGWNGGLAPELGGRLFLRGQSEVSITLQSPTGISFDSPFGLDSLDFSPAVEIRYRHHNLFGRHLVGSVSLGAVADVGREGIAGDTGWSLVDHGYKGSADLALPLSRVSILKGGLSWAQGRSDRDPDPILGTYEFRSSFWSASLGWQSDTTDDPFTPREGRRIEATLSHTWGDQHIGQGGPFFEPDTLRLGEEDIQESSAVLSGIWFWPLSSRLSLGAGASIGASDGQRNGSAITQAGTERQGSGRFRSAAGQLEVTILGNLRSRPGAATHCWWEVQGLLSRGGWEGGWSIYDSLGPATTRSYRSTAAKVGLVLALRGRWGVARFRVTYWHGLSASTEPR